MSAADMGYFREEALAPGDVFLDALRPALVVLPPALLAAVRAACFVFGLAAVLEDARAAVLSGFSCPSPSAATFFFAVAAAAVGAALCAGAEPEALFLARSEEHTSELQSRENLV